MKVTFPRVATLAGLAAGLFTLNPASAQSVWNAVPFTSADTNWSTAANWTPSGVPGASSTVTFNDGTEVADAFTINNVVDGGFGGSITALTYAHTNHAQYQNTLIGSGVTLNVTGSGGVTVGQNIALTVGASPMTTISGTGGRLNVNNSSANLNVGIGEPSTGSGSPTLDLSGLDTFTLSGARVLVGVAGQNRTTGTLLLARTNTIVLTSSTSPQIDIGDNSGNNGPGSALNLGLTNAIFADNIAMGRQKQNTGGGGMLQFSSALAGNNPVAYFRGHDGVSPVATWAIGDGASCGGTPTCSGTSDFSLGSVDAVVTSMWLARNSTSGSGTVANKGTLTLGAGTFTVGNLTNAMLASAKQTATVTGTINLNGPGTLTVTNALVLAALNGFTGTANSTINLNGGTLAANQILAGGGNSTLNVTSATLQLGTTAGTALQPLSALNLTSATLQLAVSGSTAPLYVTTLTADGFTTDTNIINISALPVVGPQTVLTLIQAASPIYLSGGSFNFALGSLPGAYEGYLSNDIANSSIDLVITGSTLKTDVWNGNVDGNWNTTTANWKASGQPASFQPGDLVVFDDSLSGTANVTLAATVAPGSLTFNNSSHNYVLSGANKITGNTGLAKQGSGSVTLSESGGDDFSGGITVAGGTLILDNAASAISGGLTVNGGTVQIGNNDANGALPSGSLSLNDGSTLVFQRTDAVTVATPIAGTGALSQNGSGTLTLTAANLYTGNTSVGNGTLALSGAGSLAASAAVAVNNAGLDVSGLSAAASLNDLSLAGATVTVALNGSPAARISCANLAFSGAASHVNVSSIAPIASYPVTFTILQSVNVAMGTFNLALGTLPPGYAGSLSQSADTTAVLLTLTAGPTSVPAAVSWVGADAPNYNWSDRLNWQLPAVPGAGDNAIFTDLASQGYSALSVPGGGASALIPGTANNIVDANFTIASLTYTNANNSYHNTFINDGLTLTMTNALTIGSGSVDFGAATTEAVSISGPNASLLVSNTNSTLFVGLGSPNSGSHQVTLDMSALGTFNASVSRLLLGVGSTSCGIPLGRESAVVYLAQTNTIVAGLTVSSTETSDTSSSAVAFGVGDNNGNAGNTCYLYLGQTNAIFADAICTARQKQNAQMLFNPNITLVSHPTAYFRGRDGSSIHTWSLADGVANSGTVSPVGIEDFTGGSVDARVATMYVGRAANSTSGSGTANGTLTFDAGLFDVDDVYVGYEPAAVGKAGIGTINVSSNSAAGLGATLRTRANLSLGVSVAGSGGAAATAGTLNLTNGTAQIYGLVPGLNSTLTVAGGQLVLTNPIGSASAPLGTLNLGPLGTPDNSATLLSLPVRADSAGITVTTLNLDGSASTLNTINVESVGPVGTPPLDLPLIKYTTLNALGGTFNVALGTLPAGYAGTLVNDTANSQIVLHLTSALHPQPLITSTSLQGSNLVISGVNGFANVPFSVLSSTDLSVSRASWTQAASGVFNADGTFSLSVPVNLANPQQFFVVQVQ